MATKKSGSSAGMIAGEVGAAALAAAAAGYYFYASKDAKKNRKVAAKWAGSLQKQVIREAKKLKTLDAETVAVIVDEAAKAYATAKSIDRADLKRAADELKANWQKIAVARAPQARKAVRKMIAKGRSAAKKAMSSAKKSVKKTAKKTVKKAAKKVAKRRR